VAFSRLGGVGAGKSSLCDLRLQQRACGVPGRSTLAYSRAAIFRDIHQGCANFEDTPMTSESVAGILGWIVAVAVLAMAVVYGPLGQFGKPSKPAVATQPAPTAPAAPAPRGPVIREVPNQ
jgi:hypothetical protein